jgi:hypothetical protein
MGAKAAFYPRRENIHSFYRKTLGGDASSRTARKRRLRLPARSELTYERIAAFALRFSNRSKGGVLNEGPADVLEEITVGLVERLAGLP